MAFLKTFFLILLVIRIKSQLYRRQQVHEVCLTRWESPQENSQGELNFSYKFGEKVSNAAVAPKVYGAEPCGQGKKKKKKTIAALETCG